MPKFSQYLKSNALAISLACLVFLLIAVIIGQAIYYNSKLNQGQSKLKQEEQKTEAFLEENFTKGPNQAAIQVKIKQQTSEGEYNDTLYYTLDQWAAKSAADIEADKQARVDKWVNYVKAAKTAPPYVPTKEELQRQAEELQRQLEEVNAQMGK